MGAKRHPRACLHCNKIHYTFTDAYLMFPYIFHGEHIWLLFCNDCIVQIYAETGQGAWNYLKTEYPQIYDTVIEEYGM